MSPPENPLARRPDSRQHRPLLAPTIHGAHLSNSHLSDFEGRRDASPLRSHAVWDTSEVSEWFC